jgi:hypothetical protein
MIAQVAISVTAPATYHAKFSNQQAISTTDSLFIPIGDISAYLACGVFEDPQTQIFLAPSAICNK